MKDRKEYFFVGVEGSLYDTRNENWHKNRPLRNVYQQCYRDISNIQELKATLRYGKYAWPGGYPICFVMNDGELLCYDCVLENYRLVVWSLNNNVNDGWKPEGTTIIYEMEEPCCHCSKPF